MSVFMHVQPPIGLHASHRTAPHLLSNTLSFYAIRAHVLCSATCKYYRLRVFLSRRQAGCANGFQLPDWCRPRALNPTPSVRTNGDVKDKPVRAEPMMRSGGVESGLWLFST